MDTNKKVDLDNPLCLDESRILANVGILDLIRQNKDEDIRRSPYNDKDTKDTEDILRCLKDIICSYLLIYHNLEDDVMIKSIFNLGKSKNVVGMKIPDWMINNEMKLTENYQLYAEVFGVDVPTTQSQPIESTQGTFTVIRLRIPPRRSTRLTPPTPIPTIDEADDIILQDTLQVSLAEQKSHEELEATQNVEKVKEHLMAKEIEKLVEGSENVEVASSPLRNDDNQTNPNTRLMMLSLTTFLRKLIHQS
ncbi:hypothetical protein Tco_0644524 [Tanacetum coccineum]